MKTQHEFEIEYANRSGVPVIDLRQCRIALPCGCGDDGCEGWRMVSRDPDAIAEHLDFYAPNAPRTLVVNRFADLGYANKRM